MYDQDFVAWAEQTAQALKARDFDALDFENLIEEVQDLAARDRRELRSNLLVLLIHLLKWHYQPERRSYPGSDNLWNENSWARTISEHRDRIQEVLQDSPSLRQVLSESLADRYQKARKAAAQQTYLAIDIFPTVCPYTQDQILDDDFWPEP